MLFIFFTWQQAKSVFSKVNSSLLELTFDLGERDSPTPNGERGFSRIFSPVSMPAPSTWRQNVLSRVGPSEDTPVTISFSMRLDPSMLSALEAAMEFVARIVATVFRVRGFRMVRTRVGPSFDTLQRVLPLVLESVARRELLVAGRVSDGEDPRDAAGSVGLQPSLVVHKIAHSGRSLSPRESGSILFGRGFGRERVARHFHQVLERRDGSRGPHPCGTAWCEARCFWSWGGGCAELGSRNLWVRSGVPYG